MRPRTPLRRGGRGMQSMSENLPWSPGMAAERAVRAPRTPGRTMVPPPVPMPQSRTVTPGRQPGFLPSPCRRATGDGGSGLPSRGAPTLQWPDPSHRSGSSGSDSRGGASDGLPSVFSMDRTSATPSLASRDSVDPRPPSVMPGQPGTPPTTRGSGSNPASPPPALAVPSRRPPGRPPQHPTLP